MADTDTSKEQMFSDFLRTLARGSFDEDLTEESRQLVKELSRLGGVNGGKPKGKIVLAVEFVWERGVIDVNTRHSIPVARGC